MSNPLDAVVLIPSLHPDHLLTEYVDDLVGKGFRHILVVDDGSGPDYAPLFDDLRSRPACTVIGYPVNGGKGHALKHGITWVQEHLPSAPGIVTADSDGQHTAQDVLRCAQALNEKPDALILGSRDFSAANVPHKSRAGNRLTSFFFALLYGKWLPDTQTGLRAFSSDLYQWMLSVPGERFEYEMNMLVYASNRHIPFEIVDIETIYIEENRRTHFRPFKDSMRIYKQLFGNFLRFISSSGLSTVLDVLLFTLLDKAILPAVLPNPNQMLFWNISIQVLLANAGARICSSLFNYKVNKAYVFKRGGSKNAYLRYVLLAVAAWALSSGLISTLNVWTGADKTLLKIIIDTCLFFVNYRLQRSWVFAHRARKGTQA